MTGPHEVKGSAQDSPSAVVTAGALPSVLTMMGLNSADPAWADALEAYTRACEYVDKRRLAYESAERVASRREDEMRAVYMRLIAEGADGG